MYVYLALSLLEYVYLLPAYDTAKHIIAFVAYYSPFVPIARI